MEDTTKGRIGLGEPEDSEVKTEESTPEPTVDVKEDTLEETPIEKKVVSSVPPKKTQAEPEAKTEDYILFPELEIEGFIIRPWTLGKLQKINPHLEGIFKGLEDKNIQLSLDNIGSHIKDIYFAAIPEIIAILAISLDKTEDELEDVTIPEAIKLVFAVFKQNEESIKNVSSLLQLANVEEPNL